MVARGRAGAVNPVDSLGPREQTGGASIPTAGRDLSTRARESPPTRADLGLGDDS